MRHRTRSKALAAVAALALVIGLGVAAVPDGSPRAGAAVLDPYIVAGLSSDPGPGGPPTIVGYTNWPEGASIDIKVDNGPDGSYDWETTVTAPPNPWLVIVPQDHALRPGDRVWASDGTTIRETVVRDVRVEAVNPDTDVATGWAPGEATVLVRVNPYGVGGPPVAEQTVLVDPAGRWTADFSGPPDAEHTDIVTDQVVDVIVLDADASPGDQTSAAWSARIPYVEHIVGGSNRYVGLEYGFAPAGTSIHLDVDYDGDGTVDHQDDTVYKESSQGGTQFLLPLSPQYGTPSPGNWNIRVSNGAIVKTLVVVEPLTVTTVDVDDDVVSGTVAPGNAVTVAVHPLVGGPPLAITSPTVDPSGSWTTTPGALGDLVFGQNVRAYVTDADGDRTAAFGQATPPGPQITPDPDADLVDGQTIALTGSGWPAGKVLYVTECRLDMGLSPDSCDATTSEPYTVAPDGTVTGTFDVHRNLATNAGPYDCGAEPGCGLVGVVWPGDPGVGFPESLDTPENNPIAFTAVVPWPKSGFFKPVDNPPAVNQVKAGSDVPVKFGLGGDRGLDVFADGYPVSAAYACDANPVPELTTGDPTTYKGKHELLLDKKGERYEYKWKTDKAWKGTCRQLVIEFTDGTSMRANFQFK